MKEFLDGNKEETQTPDTPTPISSAGVPTQGHSNAAGDFDVVKELRRKVKSRKDLSQPALKAKNKLEDVSQPQYQEGPLATAGDQQDNATDRYFGSFSIEAKRNVMDLLHVNISRGIYQRGQQVRRREARRRGRYGIRP